MVLEIVHCGNPNGKELAKDDALGNAVSDPKAEVC
jgi:hypothetical protein